MANCLVFEAYSACDVTLGAVFAPIAWQILARPELWSGAHAERDEFARSTATDGVTSAALRPLRLCHSETLRLGQTRAARTASITVVSTSPGAPSSLLRGSL